MQLIKSYNCLSIYGNATLINTGWINGDSIYYQWFLHFENNTEKSATDYQKTDKNQWNSFQQFITKPDSKETVLESFMDMGLQKANGKLFSLLLEVSEKESQPTPFGIQFDKTNNEVGTIIYLKNKFPDYFDHLHKQAVQKNLKELMQIAKGIQISEPRIL